MSDLKPSVCLLSYNRSKYLRKTLEEIKFAGCPYELIINDDGSHPFEENYGEIMGTLMNQQATTVIFNTPNHNEGVGRSINKCFGIATGDILIKMDSDVTLENNWLVKTLELFEDNPRLGLLGLCHYRHDPVDMAKTIINEYDDYTEHTHILGSVFAVRREVYEEFGISSYSESFSEDWELMKKIEASDKWHNGLPLQELAHNYGMGLGKSTVALKGVEGGIETAKIHKQPYMYDDLKFDKGY